MNIHEISSLKLDDYYWRLVFGRSKRRTNFFELRAAGFKGLPSPVFFLSTGRCGTNWFTTLLSHDRSLKAFHEPRPNLGVQGKVAYMLYTKKEFQPTKHEAELLREIVLAAREQYLRYSYKTQRRFVETNNQITFLAPAIFQLFPDARFVHLNRHPGEFVRSALRRNFYNNPDDIKRIIPLEADLHYPSWDSFSALEKNSWLWNETNRFIERFKSGIPAENHHYFDFSTLDEDSISRLCTFLDVHIPEGKIRKLLHKPVNVQQSGNLGSYGSWPEEDREQLRKICTEMASRYNYQL